MFNNKYSKVLTALLIVVIIAIIGTVSYFIYDIYVVKSKNTDLNQVADGFSSSIKKAEKDTQDNNGDVANPLDTMGEGLERKKVANEKQYLEGYEIMGTISISKTGINYPILEKVTKKSLETSVAILYGVGLNKPGNTTIAGHNYRNGLFFSDNDKLKNGDSIKITDQSGETVNYIIYNMFQTTPSDASYMQRDTEGAREISLTTCNDDSSMRLVILAREK